MFELQMGALQSQTPETGIERHRGGEAHLYMSTTLVLGGAGALGRSVVRAFKSRGGAVISMDVVDSPHTSHNILLPGRIEQSSVAPAIAELEKLLSSTGSSPLTSIMCVAGGWAGGDAGADDVVDSADQMLMSSVMVSVQSALDGLLFEVDDHL